MKMYERDGEGENEEDKGESENESESEGDGDSDGDGDKIKMKCFSWQERDMCRRPIAQPHPGLWDSSGCELGQQFQ